ncbi:hypothetical protein OC25_25990 [Pedobacter kyungheensis]|uniref:Uncharacterized protein n=1 Tax=Pedobacter kyungheensis TaxID=1069985 RepID=A0A0C1F9S1_9SPHI|nr:hypothetical protein [Pedobacter kyungheensis]KIA88618.1 hypothetical protein OC25_25990 [Pedobacter kyungheensis]
MTVTVLAILETDFKPEKALAKVMNDRLQRAAKELQTSHLKSLSGRGFTSDDLVVYISYNPKYKIRYRIVNDVPADIEYFVAETCGRLGYILWRANAIGVSNEFIS